MRLSIRHDTWYRYEQPVRYSIQQLRLTPSASPSQVVIGWELVAPGKLEPAFDAYGNMIHTLVLTQPLDHVLLSVQGVVDTQPLADGRLMEEAGRIPLAHFTCDTSLTEADDALRELAHAQPALASPADLVALAGRICERIAYRSGITEVTSSAADALALGQGVCQDHAHAMLACCRARGIPARYVSGYIDPGGAPHAASHAWIDAWLDGRGWVSVDVTHARFASEQYCRVAIGRDYETAAPVRGMRVGGGGEEMRVDVAVDRLSVDQ